MKLKIAGVLVTLILAVSGLALSEDRITAPQAGTTISPHDNSDLNTQWVWGEVIGVDAPGKTLTLKYLDYETDQEKEIALAVEDSTTYDNVKSLEEIRLKDNLSIDYVSKDGKNIAKSISLEKSESTPLGNSPDMGVITPENIQSTNTAHPEIVATQGDVTSTENKPDTAGQPSQTNQ